MPSGTSEISGASELRNARRRVQDADEYGLSKQAVDEIARDAYHSGGMSSSELFSAIDAAARREGKEKKTYSN